MNELGITINAYLFVHGLSTIGAIILFLIRTENRITKLEISLKLLKEDHDRRVNDHYKTID